jgi:gas vesicle protein
MKVNEFLKDLIKKTDIDMTNADIAALLGASALREIEVPDTFVDQFYKGIYTKESALNDPEIKKKYLGAAKGEIYDGVDRSINQILRENGFTEDQISEINKKSLHVDGEYVDTKKKLTNFGEELKKIIEKGKVLDDSKGKKSDEEIRKIQEDLNNQIKALQEDHQRELDNIKTQTKLDKITGTLRGKILSYNLLDMKDDDKLDLANAKINKILSKYTIEENEKGGLDLRTKEDPRMDVYDDRRNKLSIDDLLNSELSSFVKKSDTPKGTQGGGNPSPFPVNEKPKTLADAASSRAREAATAQLEKMQKVS